MDETLRDRLDEAFTTAIENTLVAFREYLGRWPENCELGISLRLARPAAESR